MKLQSLIFGTILSLGIASCSITPSEQPSDNHITDKEVTILGRAQFELLRLQDPATGKIPENIRLRELALASTLPKTYTKNSRSSGQIFEPVGPRNVGGRTRAISFDIDHANVILAGGISGGMWRSNDKGVSWKRATNYEDQSAVSCIIQDHRNGKGNVFYYGSGESSGNSASKSFSAYYYGSGIYKSEDYGVTWTHLASTSTPTEKRGDWSYVYSVAVDNSRTDKDIVFAATSKGIRRSEDGGNSWTLVLGGNRSADYSNVVVTSTGVAYAHITSDGSKSGFWRSANGINWVKISPSDLPSNHNRTLIAIAPSNEKVVYFYTVTENSGLSDVSFWKYTYLSGNGTGSGGAWNNRSAKLPPSRGYSLNTQSTYCMSLAVKPDNENIVFLGGTNLFRSSNGFLTNNQIRQIGGYDADGYANFSYYRDNHHPDQQTLAFTPSNPNHLLAGTDGGLHYTTNSTASKVIWQSFNNGYQTTQFYGIFIDHEQESEIIGSGFQDNGSWWTNVADTTAIWKFVMGGDGAYCAKENNTNVYYYSSQNGNISRIKLNANGGIISRKRANPRNLRNGYSFVHPFFLDPTDNNKMYLPNTNKIWRNSNLNGLDNNQYNWTQIATLTGSSSITALGISENTSGVIYAGTRSQKIYKVIDNGTPNATVTEVTNNISSGAYVSNIAVDPQNSDNVLVVYSNYNVISIWSSTDGGASWENVEGNLKGTSAPGTPPNLSHISDGPSLRWAKFITTDNGNSILLGTSIGLYAVKNLDGANTEWVQQASDVIGNVVIEQIDFRESDGFCVVGTHGAGAYKTYFENNWAITSVASVETDILNIKLYPNPAVSYVDLELSLQKAESITIQLLNNAGQVVHTKTEFGTSGQNTFTIDLSNFANGLYYVSISSTEGKFTKTLLKQ